jgi:hypothetical protein
LVHHFGAAPHTLQDITAVAERDAPDAVHVSGYVQAPGLAFWHVARPGLLTWIIFGNPGSILARPENLLKWACGKYASTLVQVLTAGLIISLYG